MAQTAESQDKRNYIINDESRGGDFEFYAERLNHFGSRIKAVEFRHVSGLYARHWTSKILQKHIDHIEKLTFSDCWSKLMENGMFSQPLKVTHLIFRRDYRADCYILPKCNNLQKLELRNTHSIWYEDLQQIIRDNPALQSLVLYEFLNGTPRIMKEYSGSTFIGIYEIMMMIANNLKQLKELAIVDTTIDESQNILAPNAIYKIVKSFQHLESLAITIHPSIIGLLLQLGMECMELKHLELHQKYHGFEIALRQVLPSFKQLERLHLSINSYDENAIGCAVEHLLNLRHLFLSIDADTHHFIDFLSLFCKCQSLETITHSYRHYQTFRKPATFISVQFFEQFIEMIAITGKSNARIEVMDGGKIIGFLTINELVWRNKRMHWNGCNENTSLSNIHLLDLANQPMKSGVVTQRNLLDEIFDYLDVYSLSAMAETDTRSNKLVKDYITKHSQQCRTFEITDEFVSMDYDDRKKHYMLLHPDEFAQCVTDLQIGCYALNTSNDIAKMIQNYKFLNKLMILGEYYETFYNYPLLNVRHLIFDTSHFMEFKHLKAILKWMPKVEIIEFKKAGIFNDFDYDKGHRPIPKNAKLKKFIFMDRGETQRINLIEIFKYKRTQLIAI